MFSMVIVQGDMDEKMEDMDDMGEWQERGGVVCLLIT
jgi:hypothetical protein